MIRPLLAAELPGDKRTALSTSFDLDPGSADTSSVTLYDPPPDLGSADTVIADRAVIL
jgi:hypothetical protein